MIYINGHSIEYCFGRDCAKCPEKSVMCLVFDNDTCLCQKCINNLMFDAGNKEKDRLFGLRVAKDMLDNQQVPTETRILYKDGEFYGGEK